MIDRGFAVAGEGSYTIKDTHNYSRLCLVSLVMRLEESGVTVVTLSSEDSSCQLEFSLPSNFQNEPKER